jgi:hypothetical protein
MQCTDERKQCEEFKNESRLLRGLVAESERSLHTEGWNPYLLINELCWSVFRDDLNLFLYKEVNLIQGWTDPYSSSGLRLPECLGHLF